MSDVQQVQFTFLACSDLKVIWEAIASPRDNWGVTVADNLAAAREFAAGFSRHCSLLASNPEMGPARGELQHDVRSSRFQKYVVFYRVRGDRIEVLRVLRAARDVEPAA